MISTTILPPELEASVGTENKDFAVKSTRHEPLKKSLGLLLFSFFWLAISGTVASAFIGPVLMGQDVNFNVNDVPTTASPDNLGPLLMPGIFIGIFLLIGFAVLGYAIFSLFRRGGYFVGTPTRLASFRAGVLRSIDWEQFTGTIEVRGNSEKGTISLELRTGHMVHRKNRPNEYVPDTIYMAGIPNAYEIEQICRKRIKENDPTPPVSGVRL